MSETKKQQIEDIEYAIAKATENIKHAERLGMKRLAQQTRRDRKRYIAKLEELTA